MKIYISGKITGLDLAEATLLFHRGELELLAMAQEAINPMTLPHKHDKSWQSYMRECIKALCDCDGIYMIGDWINSKGAAIELHIAQVLGLKIIYQDIES